MMQRRTLITLPGAVALAAVRPALAQAHRVARIGILENHAPSNPKVEPASLPFMEELRTRGWVEGRNLQVTRRFTENSPTALPGLVAELLATKVEVILVSDDSWAGAVRGFTAKPIVFSHGVAPVESGLVASLARPGGNVTGVVSLAGDLAAKQIELARSLRPDLKRLAVTWFPEAPVSGLVLEKQRAAAAKLGVEVVPLPVSDLPIWGSAEWDAALATAVRAGAQMLSMHPPGFVLQRLADWGIKNRIIVFGPAEQGFVMNYFADPAELMRSTARLVAHILRGTAPADLPVEQARHFRLGLNARTAQAMRLSVPKDLLALADQVIQ